MKYISWVLLIAAIAYILFLRKHINDPCPVIRDTVIVTERDHTVREIAGEITPPEQSPAVIKKNVIPFQVSDSEFTSVSSDTAESIFFIRMKDSVLEGTGKLTLSNCIPKDFKFTYKLIGFDSVTVAAPFKNPVSDRSGIFVGAFLTTMLQTGPLIQYHNVEKQYDIIAGISVGEPMLMLGYTRKLSINKIFSRKK